MNSVDVVIIGGGIVGLATAYSFMQQHPHKKILILEKEDRLAQHQTGHNSGVLHSGIYYKPGSFKATTCREGKKLMEEFCTRENVDYKICGKVIVAKDEREVAALNLLYERGRANGVSCEVIGTSRLEELEPHVKGVRALHVPETGIVDYNQVCDRVASRIREHGHEILNGARVTGLKESAKGVIVKSRAGEFPAGYVVNCGGLHSDRLTSLGGNASPARIVPFRGEYYKLKPEAEHLCNSLIYPVADPRFPFLGVHLTRMISGEVECGPNAVLALAREGYRKTDVSIADTFETLTYPGFIRLAAKHWRMELGEIWRSLSKAAFVKALRRLVPEIRADQLVPAMSGVRAQAVSRDGTLLDDFCFEERPRVINVVNAPSPAATASLSIGKLIVNKLTERFY